MTSVRGGDGEHDLNLLNTSPQLNLLGFKREYRVTIIYDIHFRYLFIFFVIFTYKKKVEFINKVYK